LRRLRRIVIWLRGIVIRFWRTVVVRPGCVIVVPMVHGMTSVAMPGMTTVTVRLTAAMITMTMVGGERRPTCDTADHEGKRECGRESANSSMQLLIRYFHNHPPSAERLPVL
jgi:hypothetical protein